MLIESGEPVRAGQLIARLRNELLLNEVQLLTLKADEARIQIRVHNEQREWALAQSHQEFLDGIEFQLSEKQEEADGLNVYAPQDGFIYQHRLVDMPGRFVKRGDVICQWARNDRKEVHVLIEQSDLTSTDRQANSSMRVLMPGREIFVAKVRLMDPSASRVPVHATLCAHAGGPLAVRPAANPDASEPAFELLSPRFTAELMTDSATSESLHSGQRGWAFFQTRRQSLGIWLYRSAESWLKRKIETAVKTATF